MGNKTFLMLASEFSDTTGTIPSAATLTARLASVCQYLKDNSFSQLTCTATFFTMKLSNDKAYYTQSSGYVSNDMNTAATAAGYDLSSYDFLGYGFPTIRYV